MTKSKKCQPTYAQMKGDLKFADTQLNVLDEKVDHLKMENEKRGKELADLHAVYDFLYRSHEVLVAMVWDRLREKALPEQL